MDCRCTRRSFMKGGALALLGLGSVPRFLVRAASAHGTGPRPKILVAIFQRGAVDGLTMVVPHGDPGYYSSRSSIAIGRPTAGGSEGTIDLDGFFGLHPSMAPLKPIWDARHLAFVHACGSPDTTRSHFDAQDYMESGTPGVKITQDGWLARGLGAAPVSTASPFRAVAMGPRLPRMLRGDVGAVAMGSVADFDVKQGGWGMASRLVEFSQGLAALYRDLGDRMADVVVLTMSEFGRTVRENGNRGTDHGHATAMLVLGGPVKGGQVYGRWPGLAREQLFEGRDLAVTTDFRDLFAEVAIRHVGVPSSAPLFPGFPTNPSRYPGVLL